MTGPKDVTRVILSGDPRARAQQATTGYWDQFARMEQIIRAAIAAGQRDPSGDALRALGMDMDNPKWRFGFGGWERQAHQMAGCFPASDWYEELIQGDWAAVDARDRDQPTE